MKFIMTYILLVGIQFVLPGQNKEEKKGTISYKSSQNIYVKFPDTKGISTGDTLFIKINNLYEPLIKVQFMSTTSAAGESINNKIIPKVNDIVYALIIPEAMHISENLSGIKQDTLPGIERDSINETARVSEIKTKSNYTGKLSVQSASDFNNYRANNGIQRWRYSFSYNADNISGTGISLSNYIVFNYCTNKWQNVKSNIFNALKIYDLALKYDASDEDEIWIGRHLNMKLSNIGSVDGVQYEKKIFSFYTGVILGSRPDFNNLGFDANLFEFGGYIGRTDSLNGSYMENTFSLVQQTNHFKIDRRFIYFQHSNDIIPDVNIFFSSELDLYERVKGAAKNSFTLTGLFLSARYNPLRWVSFDLSYDARKNVIYYETFKNFTDSLLDKETRQGFRFGVNLRPLNYIFIGLNSGYRFQKNDVKPTRNFNGYINYSRIPLIDISTSISYNYLVSNFINANIWGIRLMKDIDFNNSNISLSLRRSNYKYPFSNINAIQDNITLDFSTQILHNFYLSVSWDEIFENEKSNGRVFLGFTTRF